MMDATVSDISKMSDSMKMIYIGIESVVQLDTFIPQLWFVAIFNNL